MLDEHNYNITLINEVLKNTKGKRLYSRFGAFFNEKALNFNHLDKSEEKSEEEPDENSEEIDLELSKSNDNVAINPFTLEEVPINQTQLVIFYPESLNYSGKKHITPNCVLNSRNDVFERVDSDSTKKVIQMLFARSFPNKTKKLEGRIQKEEKIKSLTINSKCP